MLGVFQAAWQAKPSEVIAVDRGKPVGVPVGMGVVIPAARVLELLNMPETKKVRNDFKAEHAAKIVGASPLSASASTATPERPATEGDAHHKGRFDEALGKPKQGG